MTELTIPLYKRRHSFNFAYALTNNVIDNNKIKYNILKLYVMYSQIIY